VTGEGQGRSEQTTRPSASGTIRPAAPAARAGAGRAQVKPVFEDSNVRDVLAALGETSATGETRLMHAPPLPVKWMPLQRAMGWHLMVHLDVRKASVEALAR